MKFFKLATIVLLTIAFVFTCLTVTDSPWANRDGKSQLALMDTDIPVPTADERKASDFERAKEVLTWENHDGAWALKDVVYTEPVNVTFINNNPEKTIIGLVKFLDYNEETGKYGDYELMNLQWTEKNRIVKLDPGHYGATQIREMPGQGILQKIKSFKEFDVINEPFVVEFEETDMSLPNNVI